MSPASPRSDNTGAEIGATVAGHALLKHLPGYIGVVLHGEDGAVYTLSVIEVDENEAHFAVGNRVVIDVRSDARPGDEFSTSWLLRDRTRTQRVQRQ